MPEPIVAAIMLTRDRPEMARRAISAFRAQTYERKRLLVVRSAAEFECITDPMRGEFTAGYSGPQVTIGVLRNGGNESAKLKFNPDIIVHWDDDDLSHRERIAEQVALLQSSGAQCVGYRELLFWDTRPTHAETPPEKWSPLNEAWLYRNPDPRWVAGASMCYWRSAWEDCPFDDAPHEDQRWWLKNAAKCVGTQGISEGIVPRLICQMHDGGTEQIPRHVMESGGGGVWSPAPEWNNYCRARMAL